LSPRGISKSTVNKKKKTKTDWISILQFGGSSVALAFYWTGALGSAIYGLYQIALYSDPTAIDLFLTSAALFWAGLLLLPSAAYSLARLAKRPLRQFGVGGAGLVPALLLIFVVVLVAGHVSAVAGGAAWFALPPLHVLAASLPMVGFAWLGIRKLKINSAQTLTGGFASGLTLAPTLAITLEILAAILLFFLFVFLIALNPDLANALESLQADLERFQNDPEQILQTLSELLNQPAILTLVLIFFSVAVPLVEEIAKPAAVWLLMWSRPLRPSEGFAVGLLGGAGFGLFENLLSGATTEHWAGVTTLRIGATAFHMATAGVMGWALVRAKEDGKYLSLLGIYFLSVVVHGIWNGIVIANSFSSIADTEAGQFLPYDLSIVSIGILMLIGTGAVALIALFGQRLAPKPASRK
jgi:hypothetical protein